MIRVKMDNNTVNLLVRNYDLSMKCLPSNTDLQYKWNRKNASLPASAVGANTSILTIYSLTPEDAGDYQCVMTNISGVLASQFDTLKINGIKLLITMFYYYIHTSQECTSYTVLIP